MKATFWSSDDGGSGFYRMQLPTTALKLLGHDTYANHRLMASKAHEASVVGHRVCGQNTANLWRGLAAEGYRLIYDVDDDYFNIDPESEQSYAFYTDEILENMRNNARCADVVTVCSEQLAEIFYQFNDNVYIIPNGLPANVLNWQKKEADNGKFTIGLVLSGQSVIELAPIAPILVKLLNEKPNYEVHVIGAQPELLLKYGLKHPNVRYTTWVGGPLEVLRRCDFDVWLAPYRDTPFNNAKFPTKVLESSFLKIPIIASNIRGYREYINPNVTGFLVKEDYQWAKYINMLANDKALREQIGRNQHENASNYTMESLAPVWEDALFGKALYND